MSLLSRDVTQGSLTYGGRVGPDEKLGYLIGGSLDRNNRGINSDRGAELWRRLLPPDYGWLFCAVTKEGYVWSGGQLGAEHSSANREDIEVPIAFFGPGIRGQRIERPASTVDIAPTVAALLGLSPSELLDGHVLREVVGH